LLPRKEEDKLLRLLCATMKTSFLIFWRTVFRITEFEFADQLLGGEIGVNSPAYLLLSDDPFHVFAERRIDKNASIQGFLFWILVDPHFGKTSICCDIRRWHSAKEDPVGTGMANRIHGGSPYCPDNCQGTEVAERSPENPPAVP